MKDHPVWTKEEWQGDLLATWKTYRKHDGWETLKNLYDDEEDRAYFDALDVFYGEEGNDQERVA